MIYHSILTVFSLRSTAEALRPAQVVKGWRNWTDAEQGFDAPNGPTWARCHGLEKELWMKLSEVK